MSWDSLEGRTRDNTTRTEDQLHCKQDCQLPLDLVADNSSTASSTAENYGRSCAKQLAQKYLSIFAPGKIDDMDLNLPAATARRWQHRLDSCNSWPVTGWAWSANCHWTQQNPYRRYGHPSYGTSLTFPHAGALSHARLPFPVCGCPFMQAGGSFYACANILTSAYMNHTNQGSPGRWTTPLPSRFKMKP